MLLGMRFPHVLAVVMIIAAGWTSAGTIQWFSDQSGTNQNSDGQPMDADYVFELGVFSGGFIPTAGNVAEWDGHWQSAQSVNYNATSNQFSASLTVNDNDPPFVVGALGWIMATKTTSTGTERLLMRRPAWTWPEANDPTLGPPGAPIDWRVNGDANIQVVLGTVNPGGSPFLMRSEITRDYAQWRVLRLAGEPQDEPGDDPDRDGVSNLLEFVFDTLPKDATSRAVATGSFLEIAGEHYLQLTMPRKRTHLASLAVEVSSDLEIWDSGDTFTTVVEDTPAQWIVRDKTPVSSAPGGRRFIRLKAAVAP